MDLSGLDPTKPLTAFIEKVSSAIGTAYEPTQRVRLAKADAKVALINAEAEVRAQLLKEELLNDPQALEIQKRAVARLAYEEVRKQDNIEAVIKEAIPLLEDKNQAENLNEDWLAYFFEKAKMFSDDQMRTLWAKILAGETNKAGSFSRRTIEELAKLDKYEAKAFSVLSSFVCMKFFEPLPVVMNHKDTIYESQGVNFNSLMLLDSLGLIKYHAIGSLSFQYKNKHDVLLSYDKESFSVEVEGDFLVGEVSFTKVGQEIFKILDVKPVDGFIDYVTERWKKSGHKVKRNLKVQHVTL